MPLLDSWKNAMANATPRSSPDLSRIGLATQEQEQTRKKPLATILNENGDALEKLLRSLPQIEQVLADIRKGLRSRANSFTSRTFDTNSSPATGIEGFHLTAARHNGGVPWDSFTIDDVGGAGATLTASVNGSERIPVAAGDVFDNLEIWDLALRVGTGGAGTGRVVLTSYIPGIGGQQAFARV